MHNTLKKTINAEEQLIEHKGENIMESNREQVMENKPLGFTRPKFGGQFSLLIFILCPVKCGLSFFLIHN